ncbi:MAG TPA: CPBP family intramembrane glutamic endopeptidase [Chthoniobacterales bacterium]|jgi:membrane protease YdiL (CAAX protease family)|nr:CPBP family intramembrane glutamic endopeptidase [Chthoniobacterales bacterium]
MTADGFLPALSAVINAFFLVAGVYIYVSLLRQVSARTVPPETPLIRNFGLPEAIVAILLTLFFLLTLTGASSQSAARMRDRDLIASAAFTIGLLLALAGFLRLRRLDLDSLGGFSRVGFFRAAVTGGVLILAAYPLIIMADVVTQRLLRTQPQKQAIVEMFSGSNTLQQRMLIIVLAISVAPLAEEFIFRFFLYGVVRRYFGRALAVLVSAALFAAVHAHLPSFAPLFVLGACFAVAYEWSGSILVPMTMHAFFNAITLTALAFPELVQQQ